MTEKVIIFKIKNMLYSIDSYLVKEILSDVSITISPNSPGYLLGTISHSGEILPLIELDSFFYNDLEVNENTNDDLSRYIVVEKSEYSIVLKVKDILGNYDISRVLFFDNIYSIMEFTNSFQFKGSFLFNDEIVVQLDIDALIETILSETSVQLEIFQKANQELNIKEVEELFNKKEEYNIQLIKDLGTEIIATAPLIDTRQITFTQTEQYLSGILVQIENTEIFIQDTSVEEVFSKSKVIIEEVPKEVPTLTGAINYRGDVLSVISLKEVLFPQSRLLSQHADTSSDQIVILNSRDQSFALSFTSVKKWEKVKQSDFRKIILPDDATKNDYIFTGGYIDENDNIIFVLNVEWIINNYDNAEGLKHHFQKTIFFKNPKKKTAEISYEKGFEGLLIKSGHHYFMLDTSIIRTIRSIEDELYIQKQFNDKGIIGLGIHNQIHPIINFHQFVFENKNKEINLSNSALITLEDPRTKREIGLLVEEIVAKAVQSDLNVFQKGTYLDKDVCDDIYQGFFDYFSILGGILNSRKIIAKLQSKIENEFGEQLSLDYFGTLISEEEKEKLYDFIEKQKEIEFMLFDDSGKEKRDYLVFSLNDIYFGLNPYLVVSIIYKDKIKKTAKDNYPIIGKLDYENRTIPIVDLVGILFPTEEYNIEMDENLFLLFKGEASETIYALPTKNISGVLSNYTEDLILLEENETFNDIHSVCKYHFTNERIDSPIYCVDDSFIHYLDDNKILIENIEKLCKK